MSVYSVSLLPKYSSRIFCRLPDITEVFSRSQDPQDWYMAKRFDDANEGQYRESPQERVYMEIGRKEASLADVDNELSGVVRRFQES